MTPTATYHLANPATATGLAREVTHVFNAARLLWCSTSAPCDASPHQLRTARLLPHHHLRRKVATALLLPMMMKRKMLLLLRLAHPAPEADKLLCDQQLTLTMALSQLPPSHSSYKDFLYPSPCLPPQKYLFEFDFIHFLFAFFSLYRHNNKKSYRFDTIFLYS